MSKKFYSFLIGGALTALAGFAAAEIGSGVVGKDDNVLGAKPVFTSAKADAEGSTVTIDYTFSTDEVYLLVNGATDYEVSSMTTDYSNEPVVVGAYENNVLVGAEVTCNNGVAYPENIVLTNVAPGPHTYELRAHFGNKNAYSTKEVTVTVAAPVINYPDQLRVQSVNGTFELTQLKKVDGTTCEYEGSFDFVTSAGDQTPGPTFWMVNFRDELNNVTYGPNGNINLTKDDFENGVYPSTCQKYGDKWIFAQDFEKVDVKVNLETGNVEFTIEVPEVPQAPEELYLQVYNPNVGGTAQPIKMEKDGNDPFVFSLNTTLANGSEVHLSLKADGKDAYGPTASKTLNSYPATEKFAALTGNTSFVWTLAGGALNEFNITVDMKESAQTIKFEIVEKVSINGVPTVELVQQADGSFVGTYSNTSFNEVNYALAGNADEKGSIAYPGKVTFTLRNGKLSATTEKYYLQGIDIQTNAVWNDDNTAIVASVTMPTTGTLQEWNGTTYVEVAKDVTLPDYVATMEFKYAIGSDFPTKFGTVENATKNAFISANYKPETENEYKFVAEGTFKWGGQDFDIRFKESDAISGKAPTFVYPTSINVKAGDMNGTALTTLTREGDTEWYSGEAVNVATIMANNNLPAASAGNLCKWNLRYNYADNTNAIYGPETSVNVTEADFVDGVYNTSVVNSGETHVYGQWNISEDLSKLDVTVKVNPKSGDVVFTYEPTVEPQAPEAVYLQVYNPNVGGTAQPIAMTKDGNDPFVFTITEEIAKESEVYISYDEAGTANAFGPEGKETVNATLNVDLKYAAFDGSYAAWKFTDAGKYSITVNTAEAAQTIKFEKGTTPEPPTPETYEVAIAGVPNIVLEKQADGSYVGTYSHAAFDVVDYALASNADEKGSIAYPGKVTFTVKDGKLSANVAKYYLKAYNTPTNAAWNAEGSAITASVTMPTTGTLQEFTTEYVDVAEVTLPAYTAKMNFRYATTGSFTTFETVNAEKGVFASANYTPTTNDDYYFKAEGSFDFGDESFTISFAESASVNGKAPEFVYPENIVVKAIDSNLTTLTTLTREGTTDWYVGEPVNVKKTLEGGNITNPFRNWNLDYNYANGTYVVYGPEADTTVDEANFEAGVYETKVVKGSNKWTVSEALAAQDVTIRVNVVTGDVEFSIEYVETPEAPKALFLVDQSGNIDEPMFQNQENTSIFTLTYEFTAATQIAFGINATPHEGYIVPTNTGDRNISATTEVESVRAQYPGEWWTIQAGKYDITVDAENGKINFVKETVEEPVVASYKVVADGAVIATLTEQEDGSFAGEYKHTSFSTINFAVESVEGAKKAPAKEAAMNGSVAYPALVKMTVAADGTFTYTATQYGIAALAEAPTVRWNNAGTLDMNVKVPETVALVDNNYETVATGVALPESIQAQITFYVDHGFNREEYAVDGLRNPGSAAMATFAPNADTKYTITASGTFTFGEKNFTFNYGNLYDVDGNQGDGLKVVAKNGVMITTLVKVGDNEYEGTVNVYEYLKGIDPNANPAVSVYDNFWNLYFTDGKYNYIAKHNTTVTALEPITPVQLEWWEAKYDVEKFVTIGTELRGESLEMPVRINLAGTRMAYFGKDYSVLNIVNERNGEVIKALEPSANGIYTGILDLEANTHFQFTLDGTYYVPGVDPVTVVNDIIDQDYVEGSKTVFGFWNIYKTGKYSFTIDTKAQKISIVVVEAEEVTPETLYVMFPDEALKLAELKKDGDKYVGTFENVYFSEIPFVIADSETLTGEVNYFEFTAPEPINVNSTPFAADFEMTSATQTFALLEAVPGDITFTVDWAAKNFTISKVEEYAIAAVEGTKAITNQDGTVTVSAKVPEEVTFERGAEVVGSAYLPEDATINITFVAVDNEWQNTEFGATTAAAGEEVSATFTPEEGVTYVWFGLDGNFKYEETNIRIPFNSVAAEPAREGATEVYAEKDTHEKEIVVTWNKATDGEVRGYNVYVTVDGVVTKANKELIEGNEFRMPYLPVGTTAEIVVETVYADGVTVDSDPVEFTQTGINGIYGDSDAVYYDINGNQVVNPENGLYIRVANGKAEKMIIRK